MHKRNRKIKGGFRARSRNANTRIPPSAADFIETLLGEFDDEWDPGVVHLRNEYLSKLCSEKLVPAEERRSAAIRKFAMTEVRNAETNRRLRTIPPDWNILPRVGFGSFLRFSRSLISRILGPLHDSIVLGSFSGGASTSRRRTQSHPAQKFAGQADVTSECQQYIDIVYRESALLKQYAPFSSFREVRGADLFTVPKKTDIDRCACKEPDVNMFLQKGVGRHIRQRLLKFGINLNDQSINRRLAHRGSVDGSLATLDLSSASDTVTIEAVRLLLPTEWFLYLNDLRSQAVRVDGRYFRTEMFSSMGNGFTFELESLIFYALMRAAAWARSTPGIISVYGDDIIIPSEMYDDATWVLQTFGFEVNLSKSFHTGSFRESCGGHYFDGRDVTPFYLKRRATRLTDVIRLANQLRRWAFADPSRRYSSPAIYKIWLKLAKMVPKVLWGGCDYNSDTQLVAPCPPKSRLVRVSQDKELPENGRYLQWHNTNWNRRIDPEGGFEPVETETFCRIRASTPGAPSYGEYFYEELFPGPDPR